MRVVKTVLGAMAIAAASAVAATAATLSLVGGTATLLPANFNPTPALTAPKAGDTVTAFSGNFLGQGLFLTAPEARVTFTFLGKEAGATNASIENVDGQTLGTGTPGASLSFTQVGSGLIDFTFTTTANGFKTITNGVGGPIAPTLYMAFSEVFNDGKSVYALFGDGGRDFPSEDYDDYVMRIDVAAIPLPAGGLLLLTALGGIAALRRRKVA